MYNICTMSEVLSSPDDFEEIVSGCGKEDDDIPAPRQCKYCPRVTAMQDYLDSLKKSAAYLVEAAMGDKVIMSIDGETIDGDEATRYLCKKAVEELNKLDKETDTIREEIVRSTNGCKGPLDLERSDGRRTVRVTVCDSSEMFDSAELGEEQIGEPVAVQRDLKKNED